MQSNIMTFREAFSRMQEPYSTLAIKNTKPQYLDIHPLIMNPEKISDCLSIAFVWADTPEGETFWRQYRETLKNLGL